MKCLKIVPREELIKQIFYENKEELKCLKKTILSY